MSQVITPRPLAYGDARFICEFEDNQVKGIAKTVLNEGLSLEDLSPEDAVSCSPPPSSGLADYASGLARHDSSHKNTRFLAQLLDHYSHVNQASIPRPFELGDGSLPP
ncbi:hypothetical protein AX14_000869 [Amanita brunnescens Koide BX004]|nr:hypothetical protein AX14_000869 [Amanita brunnescens Koide BX004]